MANEKNWEDESKQWKNLFYSKDGTLIKWLFKVGKKSDKILDQGCGIGQYAFTVYKFGFKKVVGLDYSEKLIETAKENAKKLKYKIGFVKGDIREMPFKDNSFDIVISGGVIEHVPESLKTIEELSRIIKKEGYLLIHIPQKISTFTLLKLFQKAIGTWKLGYEKSFTKKGFTKMLNQSGFEVKDYFLGEFTPGRHKILGSIIRLIDKPLYLIGFGGYHMSFLCKKVK